MSLEYLKVTRNCGKGDKLAYEVEYKTGFIDVPSQTFLVCKKCLKSDPYFSFQADIIKITPLKEKRR